MSQPKKPDWLVPDYPELRGTVGQAAVADKIVYYPQVVRSNADFPIDNQNYGLVSFQLLDKPQKTSTGSTVHGFFKIRGNWSDASMAKSKASSIVRDQDSKSKIRIVNVGQWLPICDDDSLVKEMVEINTDIPLEQQKLKEELAQKNEEQKQKILREIKEREAEVKAAKDYNEDENSLDYYTMKRVAWMRLRENVAATQKQLDSLLKNYAATRDILRDLDTRHTDYSVAWLDNYNKERKKSGIPDFIPGEQEVNEYQNS